jgi:predicted RNA methylase
LKDLTALVNKSVDFAYRGARLGFDLSHALFSSYSIDVGTRLLLKEIAHDEVVLNAGSILDAGCGAGILGISLAACSPDAQVVLRDRDVLACEFSERNCWKNGIPVQRCDIHGLPQQGIQKRAPKHKVIPTRKSPVIIAPGLLGEDDPLGPYDVVVSNLPAKAGKTILTRFVESCENTLLNPGGRLAIVIVNSLRELAQSWCDAPGMKLVRNVEAKSHSVFIFEKPQASGKTEVRDGPAPYGIPIETRMGKLGLYERTSGLRRIGRYDCPACGYWGLPEFDTNGFFTDLAVEALERASAGSLVRDFMVVEPGIGLAAIWAAKVFGPARVHAVSRDLLSLSATGANLKKSLQPGAGPEYLPYEMGELSDLPETRIDSILIFPDPIPEFDYIAPLWNQVMHCTKRGSGVTIVTTATIASRVEKIRPKGIRRLGEKKRKGYTALFYIRE